TSLPPPSPCAPGASPPPDRPDIAPPSPSAAAPASATALPLSLAALPPRCNSCFSYNSIPAENSSEKVTASEHEEHVRRSTRREIRMAEEYSPLEGHPGKHPRLVRHSSGPLRYRRRHCCHG